MSDAVTLSLRAAPPGRVDLDGVTADRCAVLAEGEIARLPIWIDSRQVELGELFTVRGERATRLVVEGPLAGVDGLGGGTAAGEMLVDGDAGARAGARMTGGRIEVRGSAGDEAGLAMGGGTLRIHGGAGDRLGAATPGASRGMTGGEIVVGGTAGDAVGACLRRGLIVVGGDTGAETGRAMIAGTVVVLGRVGPHPAGGNKRGSLIAAGPVDVPPTYRYACTFEPTYVRFLMTYLARTYGLAIPTAVVEGRYRRYTGDAGLPGKGEILALTP